MLRTLALSSLAVVAADITASRTINSITAGSGTITLEGSACSSKDQYGSNDCDLDWGSTYAVDIDVALAKDVTSSHSFSVDAKLDGLIGFKFSCAVCGANCSFTVPIVHQKVSFALPPCPIKAGPFKLSTNFTLPAKSPVPISASAKGKVTVSDGTATIADIDVVGKVSPSAGMVEDRVSAEDITFDEYVARWGKVYASAEERAAREAAFLWAKKVVLAHNKAYHAGEETWWMSLNQLADYSPAEFQTLRSTKYAPSAFPTARLGAAANPTSVDWREKGAVTDVKNQGGCGSCWAFSATETVESHYQIASGRLLELAPQTYVDCVKNPNSCGGTGGCEGATMELAFNLTASTGIALEADMPYKGRDKACAAYKAAVKAKGYVKLPTNDAGALETALATIGPISITVSAEPWQLYGGGVFSGCSSGLFKSNTLDHGVQAVGYTSEYWIVRNSWGAGWGEKGYIRISRANDAKTFVDKHPADGVACKPSPKTQTVGGECGMLFDTSYPTGVTAA